MKSLTDAQKQAIAKGKLYSAYLLDITLQGAGAPTLHISDRTITVSSVTYQNYLEDLSGLGEEIDRANSEGRNADITLVFKNKKYLTYNYLSEIGNTYPFEGALITIKEVLIDDLNVPGEPITIHVGLLDEAQDVDTLSFTYQASSLWKLKDEQFKQALITAAVYPGADLDDINKPANIIYGSNQRVKCRNIKLGWMTTLLYATSTSGFIVVDVITGCPAAPFTIHVQQEQMRVTSVIPSADYIMLGVTRGYNGSSNINHARGLPVVEDSDNELYLVANHSVQAINNIFNDENQQYITASLQNNVTNNSIAFQCDRPESFPPAGRYTIRIDQEEIRMMSNSMTGQLDVMTGGRGYNGTTAAAHSAGAIISCLTPKYTIYTGQSGDELTGYEGQAIIKFLWRLGVYEGTPDVYVDVDGYKDDASGTYTGTANALIERPNHVFKHFLDVYFGYSLSDIDTASFAAAGALHASAISGGYKFAFCINKEIRSAKQEILENLASQCRSTLVEEGGKWYLDYIPDTAPAADKTIKASELAGEYAKFLFGKTRRVDIENDLTAKFSENYGKLSYDESEWQGTATTSDATSQGKYGIKPATYIFNAIRSQAMADHVLAFKLLQKKNPLWLMDAALFWQHYDLERGDTVVIENTLNNGMKFFLEWVGRPRKGFVEVKGKEWAG